MFNNFKFVYGTIDRDQLWQIVYEYGFSDKPTKQIDQASDVFSPNISQKVTEGRWYFVFAVQHHRVWYVAQG